MQDKAVKDLTDRLRARSSRSSSRSATGLPMDAVTQPDDRPCRPDQGRSSTPRPTATGRRPTTDLRDRVRPHADDRRRARAGHRHASSRTRSPATRRPAAVDFRVALNAAAPGAPVPRLVGDRRRAGWPRRRVRGRRHGAQHQRHRPRRGHRLACTATRPRTSSTRSGAPTTGSSSTTPPAWRRRTRPSRTRRSRT